MIFKRGKKENENTKYLMYKEVPLSCMADRLIVRALACVFDISVQAKRFQWQNKSPKGERVSDFYSKKLLIKY